MVSYTNPGGRIGPKTKTSKRTITNPDGTRTIITTTEVTTTTAFKEETTKKVDTKHLPSLPRIRREKIEMDDGTSGWKKISTVVHPSGQREITIEYPDGEKEVKIEEGPKSSPDAVPVESIPKEHNKPLPSWPSYPWDSTLKRLAHHADVTPHKNALAFLQTNGNNTPTTSSSMTYQKLNFAVEYLASRLLPPEGVELDDPKNKALIPLPKDQTPLAKGDRVLLVYPPCAPHFILAFLACIRAGLVAVPVYPPHPGRKDSISAFVGIARGCGAKVALTNGEYAQAKRLAKMKDGFMSKTKKKKMDGEDDNSLPSWSDELIWVVTDKEPLLNPPTVFPKTESSPEPHETAFIQYTSGSTSAPKGVTLTHSNLAHNLYIITDELDASSDTTVVSWLPQYHDMGLIGSLIGILYCGGSGYYMSPIAFLQRPMGWIEAVSEYRGTHLQSPNFAFGLTARKFNAKEYYQGTGGITVNDDGKQVKPLDLSCLKHIINGAEPVTEKSMGAFVKAFTPFGLPDGVIFPTYGLAEHTVFVCSGGKGKIAIKKKELEEENKVVLAEDSGESTKDEGIIHFLGCGFPASQNVDVRIVDPVRRVALPDGTVGEIWVNSPSKALGYYGLGVKETKTDFHALLENMKETSEKFGGYLRTGDLGFLHEEQLYICGRIKDLIIVGGRNHYPQDIEATAEDIASAHVRPGCSAAFSIGSKSGDQGDYEEVVLALELKEPLPKSTKYESIASTVRNEVFKEHSVSLSSVVLVKQKTMPKTTSGKIQRSKAQQAFLGNTLQELHRKDFATGDVADFGDVETKGETQTIKPSPVSNLSPAEIRALDKPAIKKMLLDSISALSNTSPSSIKDKIPVREIIVDSVNLAQLKGELEGRYGVKPMSDGYLFNDKTTVKRLVEVIKEGVAKDDTGEGSSAPPPGAGGLPGCCGCTVM
mmetsp:Transcript_39224/g.84599  ORF Transcript_39224/g.84599 Transcript_39224/m.84599 type:complete len:932 (+) Transcript_39224:87-2882(+)